MTQETPTPTRREQILQTLALMLEEDSGKRITRILDEEPHATPRCGRILVHQLFERLETQLKQVLREPAVAGA